VRDLLLYCLRLLGQALQRHRLDRLSLRSVALDGSQSGVKSSYHLRPFTNC
jgi:hypothetical protein